MTRINRIFNLLAILSLSIIMLFLAMACEKETPPGEEPNGNNPTGSEVINFSNDIPDDWTVSGCEIINTEGYDDNTSLGLSENATVVFQKTGTESVDVIDFFVKGSGELRFYVDDELMEKIDGTDGWQKFSAYLSLGDHQIRWETGDGKSSAPHNEKGDETISWFLDNVSFNDTEWAIGKPCGEGIIGYITPDRKEALVVSTQYMNTPMAWGGDGNTGAIGRYAYGDGYTNTTYIIDDLGGTTSAAYKARNNGLEPPPKAKESWFLPSSEELECIRINCRKIKGLNSGWYWSSTDLGLKEPGDFPRPNDGQYQAVQVCISPDGLMCGNNPIVSVRSNSYYVLPVCKIGR